MNKQQIIEKILIIDRKIKNIERENRRNMILGIIHLTKKDLLIIYRDLNDDLWSMEN